MRLDQFLVKSNICSRSEAKKIVKKGRVCVNDIVAADSALHIDEKSDKVTFDGSPVVYEQFRYYMFNKPAGCVSATKDGLSETVIDYLQGENVTDLFPVGRLDKDTEGLLLITNDGKLAHELLSPRHHVDKKYLAVTDGMLSEADMERFRNGLDIGEEKITLPAEICVKSDEAAILSYVNQNETTIRSCVNQSEMTIRSCVNKSEMTIQSYVNQNICGSETDELKNVTVYEVVIREGRFHQVKRMFEALGRKVLYLKRISMGTLMLDESLEAGKFRRLTKEEAEALKSHCGEK